MTRRRFEFIATVLVAIAVLAAFVIPAVQARVSWYYVGGSYDLRNLLVTCEAASPIFRATGINSGIAPETPPLADIEVYLACKARDRLLPRRLFSQTGPFGQNKALNAIVERAPSCSSSDSLRAELIERCRQAHYDAVDWLLDQGVDINAGELGTILHTAIQQVDDEMFVFLLSRGADPRYRAPLATDDGSADEGPEEHMDAEPQSAVELLELQLTHLDESRFPDEAAALRRMRSAVSD